MDLAGKYLVVWLSAASTRINRHDFGASWNSEMQDGGVVVGGAGGVCIGTCPAGRTCQTVMSLEVEFFEVPDGIPQPPSGRSGFVVKRVGKICKCLASAG